jgi:hypothetical protein
MPIRFAFLRSRSSGLLNFIQKLQISARAMRIEPRTPDPPADFAKQNLDAGAPVARFGSPKPTGAEPRTYEN